jgi:hypothetical protein
MTVAELTALVIAVGSAPVILKVIDWVKATRSGRAIREKAENRSALARLVDAEYERDDEANFRRRIEEWAGGLVYMLRQIGVPDDKIPPKPQRRKVMS